MRVKVGDAWFEPTPADPIMIEFDADEFGGTKRQAMFADDDSRTQEERRAWLLDEPTEAPSTSLLARLAAMVSTVLGNVETAPRLMMTEREAENHFPNLIRGGGWRSSSHRFGPLRVSITVSYKTNDDAHPSLHVKASLFGRSKQGWIGTPKANR